MTSTQHTITPQLIAVHRLRKSPLNVRRTGALVGIGELKASILAHGLMQNLVVTEGGDGNLNVIAGGRRLEAILSLQAEGKLPQDFEIPCQVANEAQAAEMSLAENTVRLAMHPADQFEAFAALIDQGATAAEVAERFGIEESLVLKRMKLARVAPPLLDEYRNGGLTLECLMAFTLTDDHRRQLKVYKSLQHWQKEEPSTIRAALTDQQIEASSKLARFVGLDAYSAAGGSTRADLFGDEVYLESPAVLHRLAEQKLDGIRKELEAEGWAWIEINPERDWSLVNRCTRIRPRLIGAPEELVALKSQLDDELAEIERALEDTESDALLDQAEAIRSRLDEAARQLAAFVGFDSEHMVFAGCYVSIDQDGAPFLDKGLVKPEHRKHLDRLLQGERGETTTTRAKPKDGLPESLRRDLAAFRQQIAQAEIASHPALALDLIAFRAASRMLDETRPIFDGPDVVFKRHEPRAGTDKQPTAAAKALDGIRRSLPNGWLKPKTEAARFEAFRALPQEEKLKLLACGVAMTLQPKLGPSSENAATAYDACLSMTGADAAAYWRPGKGNLLGRLTRNQLLSLARGTLGEAWALSRAGEKKAVLVGQLDRAFADPAKHGRTPEQVEKLKTWLPIGMAFTVLPTPNPADGKEAKKAA